MTRIEIQDVSRLVQATELHFVYTDSGYSSESAIRPRITNRGGDGPRLETARSGKLEMSPSPSVNLGACPQRNSLTFSGRRTHSAVSWRPSSRCRTPPPAIRLWLEDREPLIRPRNYVLKHIPRMQDLGNFGFWRLEILGILLLRWSDRSMILEFAYFNDRVFRSCEASAPPVLLPPMAKPLLKSACATRRLLAMVETSPESLHAIQES